jgi:hypothetical protein
MFVLLRVAMGFVENIRVSQERAEAGIGAEQDHPPAVFDARVISRVCVAEDAPTEGGELV